MRKRFGTRGVRNHAVIGREKGEDVYFLEYYCCVICDDVFLFDDPISFQKFGLRIALTGMPQATGSRSRKDSGDKVCLSGSCLLVAYFWPVLRLRPKIILTLVLFSAC